MNRLRFGPFVVAACLVTGLTGCACSAVTSTSGAPPVAVASAPASSAATPSPAASTAAAATKPGVCDWQPATQPSGMTATGMPATAVPHTGTTTMTIVTNRGTVEIKLNRRATPCTVASFAYLGGKHFFDKTPCHRLTTDGIFVVQCGDPTGTGSGGPAYTIPDEGLPTTPAGGTAPVVTYPRGTIAMANTGQPHSGGSQFFLVYKNSPLPYAYTKFGTITKGLGIIDKVAAAGVAADSQSPADGAPKLPLEIISLTVAAS